MNEVMEVVVPKKRFDLGTCWLAGMDEEPPHYWFLYDMLETENECFEIWVRKKYDTE